MTKHPLFPGNIPAGGSFKFSGASRNGDLDPTPSDFLPESEVFRGYALIQSNLAIAHELRTANLQRERDWTRNRPSSSENDLSPNDFTDRIYKSLGVENQETLRRSGVRSPWTSRIQISRSRMNVSLRCLLVTRSQSKIVPSRSSASAESSSSIRPITPNTSLVCWPDV